MNIAPFFKATQKFIIDNSPGILTGFGVAGAVTSAVLTGRAAYRMGFDVSEKYTDRVPAPKDLAKEYWKEFIPGAVVLAGTVVCIVGATTVSSRRTAAITAAYKLSEELADGYKKKVVETIGAQKEEKMRSDLTRDRMDTAGWANLIFTGNDTIFYDELSGRFFRNDIEKVRKAINEINHQVNNFYHASLTEFYEKIGLSGTSFSDEVGWNSDELLDVKFSATLLDEGKPAIGIAFRTAPTRGFDRCM